ncbi:MAG: hypothetical protein AB1634_04510 [Thermodesulfobacteriota bacterium]
MLTLPTALKFDEQGRLASLTGPGGVRLWLDHDASGLVTAIRASVAASRCSITDKEASITRQRSAARARAICR